MALNFSRRRVCQYAGIVSLLPFLSCISRAASAAVIRAKWAAGGTGLIEVDYPDSSLFDDADTCQLQLTPSTTRGPCYFADDTGEDISLGLEGLPMQLCLRVVDRDCQPLSGQQVEVWHCDTRGVYSGDTSESDNARGFARFCTGGDAAARNSSWYRGQLTTDAEGRVNFKTCFPGWYPGRTIHIHFAVSDAQGQSRVVSQFCFSDALAHEICTTHPHYRDRGAQDRSLASGRDGVFPTTGYEDLMLNTVRNPDGTLLAYHRIQLG